MTAEQEREIEELLQRRRLAVIQEPRATAFVHVYSFQSHKDGFHCFSFFLPSQKSKSFLSDVGWDKHDGDFTPRIESWNSGSEDERVFYTRDGAEDGSQGFIRWRTFPNYWPSSIEVCEEFRLFFNLFHHREKDCYLHCDVNGVEHEVIRVTPEKVEVSIRFLSEFLQAKQMVLALQYVGNHCSPISLSELGLSKTSEVGKNDNAIWELALAENNHIASAASISQLLGKAVIPCPGPLEWQDPYKEQPNDFQTFIVGHGASGKPILDTCDPEQIRATYDRAMAAVFFKKSVLAKYYNEPHRYEVNSTGLWCGSNWHLRMDHDGPKYVTVFLKHLSDLPAAEREHWKAYNVPPDGNISESSFIQNIRGWWANPAMPDIQFKPLYRHVNEKWQAVFGWPLWLEAPEGDAHLLRQAHVCLEDNQAEFDQQNSIMAKLLCDFLNEAPLKSHLTQPSNGSLNQLRDFLLAEDFAEANEKLGPLFAFQALRSTGSAHRKGDKYDKAMEKGGLSNLSLTEASFLLFAHAVEALQWIETCLTIRSTRS